MPLSHSRHGELQLLELALKIEVFNLVPVEMRV
jgi:hypothetical protein